MSNATAEAPARATKAPSRKQATPQAAPAPVVSQLGEGDQLAVNVGKHIYHLLVFLAEGPHSANQIPGWDQINEACNFAWDLSRFDGPWEGEGPKPTVAALVDAIKNNLIEAVTELKLPGDEAIRYSTLRLVGDALDIAAALADAYASLPSTMGNLEELGSFDGLVARNGTVHLHMPPGQRRVTNQPAQPVPRLDTDYTNAQLRGVLEFIAETTASLNNILMMAQTSTEQWDMDCLVDAAQAMCRQIGGVADAACGGSILGGHDRWNFGPNFERLGKAGAA